MVHNAGDFSLLMDGFSDSMSPPGASSRIFSWHGFSPTPVDSWIPHWWLIPQPLASFQCLIVLGCNTMCCQQVPPFYLITPDVFWLKIFGFYSTSEKKVKVNFVSLTFHLKIKKLAWKEEWLWVLEGMYIFFWTSPIQGNFWKFALPSVLCDFCSHWPCVTAECFTPGSSN